MINLNLYSLHSILKTAHNLEHKVNTSINGDSDGYNPDSLFQLSSASTYPICQ